MNVFFENTYLSIKLYYFPSLQRFKRVLYSVGIPDINEVQWAFWPVNNQQGQGKVY